MARGAKPGERRGGRQTGTPNKTTLIKKLAIEAMESPEAKAITERQVAAFLQRHASRDARGTPKAVDVLNQLMQLSMSLVAKYQPRTGNEDANEGKMQEYLPIAVKCASELARYQSPTFKAIAVQEVPPAPAARPGEDAKVVGMMGKRSQADAASAYLRLVRNDPRAA